MKMLLARTRPLFGSSVAPAVWLALAIVVCLTPQATAQTTLRWKFTPDEKLHYEMKQQTSSRMEIEGRATGTDMTQIIDSIWHVRSVNDDGSAQVEQTISRIRMNVASIEGLKIAFDSAADADEQDARASMLASMMKPLVGSVFQFRIDPSGKIHDVVLPEGLAEKLQSGPLGSAMGGQFSEEGLKQMTREATLVLPTAPLDRDETWSQQKDLSGLKLDVTYTYLGEQEYNKRRLHKIGVEAEMEFSDPPSSQAEIDIAEQSSKGTCWFDAQRGRLVESSMDQTFELDITVGDKGFSQTVNQKILNRLLPNDDEHASDDES